MGPGHVEPREGWWAKRGLSERWMPGGAPEESRCDRQPGGFLHPEKGKSGGRIKGTRQRVSRPIGTAGPLRGSAPSGFEGGTVETRDDTTSEEKTIPQLVTDAWMGQLEPGWIE
jgi:hypothetical protein